MKCQFCQHDNPDGASFCAGCGAALTPIGQAAEQKPSVASPNPPAAKQRHPFVLAIVALGLVCFAAALFFFMAELDDKLATVTDFAWLCFVLLVAAIVCAIVALVRNKHSVFRTVTIVLAVIAIVGAIGWGIVQFYLWIVFALAHGFSGIGSQSVSVAFCV